MKDDITPLLAQENLSSEARDLLSSLGPTPAMPPSAQDVLQARIETLAASPVTGVGAWPIAGTVVLSLFVGFGTLVGLRTLSSIPKASAILPEPVELSSGQGFDAVRLTPMVTPSPVVARRPQMAVAVVRPAAAQPAGGLAEELRLLSKAKGLLDENPQSALREVKLHQQRFPNGQLLDMRDYLRLRALIALGRPNTDGEIRDFLDTYPGSPFRKDVLRLKVEAR